MSKLGERVENRQIKKKSPVQISSFLLRFEENCKKDKIYKLLRSRSIIYRL